MAIRNQIVSMGHGALPSFSHIVIHETANPGATAQNHVDYWSREDDYAVHAVCDWDNIFHTVPYDRLCWHVGNANGWTIGIEICHATNKADFLKAWNNAITWTKAMMKRFNIPVSRVVSHDYCSRVWGGSDHTDPIDYFAEYGKTWGDFIAALGASTVPAQPRYRVKGLIRWGAWKSCGQSALSKNGIYDINFSGLPKGSWFRLRLKGGEWLPKNAHNKTKKPVIAITLYYATANPDTTGYYEIVYRARLKKNGAWLAWKVDDNHGGTSNGKDVLDCLQAKIRKC